MSEFDNQSVVAQAWDSVKSAVKSQFKSGDEVKRQLGQDKVDLKNYFNPGDKAKDEANVKAMAAKPKVTDIAPGHNFKSMSELQTWGYSHDKKIAEFAAARQETDPNKLPTVQLKMQSVAGNVGRITQSKEFQALDREGRNFVLQTLYQRQVKPTLMKNGLEPPSYEQWINDQAPQAKEEPKPEAGLGGTLLSGMAQGLANSADAVDNVLRWSSQETGRSNTSSGISNRVTKSIAKASDIAHDYASHMRGFSTDYNSTFTAKADAGGWAANFAGQLLGEAPAYMAAGEVLGPGFKLAEGLIPSMAERAALSKGIKVGLEGMRAAGDVFVVDKAEGKDTKEAAKNAAAAAILGPALGGIFHGVGRGIEFSTRPQAWYDMADRLKWKSAQKAVGGDALVNRVAEEAPVIKDAVEGSALTEKGTLRALVNENDPDFIRAKQVEYDVREGLAQDMHPDKASKAAVAGRKTWDYLSKGQRKAIMDQLEVEANKGAELMPLLHPEIQTVANEKEIVEDFADKPHLKAASAKIAEVYGVKPAEAMTKAQGVRTAENNGLGTKAEILEGAHRDPTALPFDIKNSKPRYGDYKIDFKDPRDLALYTVGQATKNKAHDRFMAYLLKQFPDKSEAELRAMGREVKARIQREIPNTEGDTIKLSAKEAPQPRIATKAAEDYEPEEGAFARIGVPENISYMKNYKITNIKPAALVSPKLPVEEFLKGTLQFLPETPATKSGKIYFENPEHQLLWLAHESEAPLSVRTRAATILRYQFGGKNQYLKVLQQQRASWLAHHIEMLVASGHLQGEGNVFRSTKLGPSMYGTKAQKMVPEEVSDEERALIIAEKLPKAIQNTLVDANETMTELSNKVKDPSKARARRAGAKKIVDIAQEVN